MSSLKPQESFRLNLRKWTFLTHCSLQCTWLKRDKKCKEHILKTKISPAPQNVCSLVSDLCVRRILEEFFSLLQTDCDVLEAAELAECCTEVRLCDQYYGGECWAWTVTSYCRFDSHYLSTSHDMPLMLSSYRTARVNFSSQLFIIFLAMRGSFFQLKSLSTSVLEAWSVFTPLLHWKNVCTLNHFIPAAISKEVFRETFTFTFVLLLLLSAVYIERGAGVRPAHTLQTAITGILWRQKAVLRIRRGMARAYLCTGVT